MTTTADDDSADGPVSVSSGGGYLSDRYTWRRRVVAFQVVAIATCAVLAQTSSDVTQTIFGSAFLTWGGALTVVSCLSVIVTYWKFKPWRAHPNPLVFWRSVADLCFGGCCIFNAQNEVVFQVVALAFGLAAESWYSRGCRCERPARNFCSRPNLCAQVHGALCRSFPFDDQRLLLDKAAAVPQEKPQTVRPIARCVAAKPLRDLT
jgi:hypothetical protein